MLNRVKFLINKVPSYLVFWVTQNCNASCAFCFNWQENTKQNNDLTIGEIRSLTKNYPHLKYLTLAGGEPTLRCDLPEIVGAFVENSGLQMCTIITNGLKYEQMLEDTLNICQRYPNLGLNIAVSIDFIGKEHDNHRKLDGCYAGCIKIIEGVKRIRSNHLNVMVSAHGTYTKSSAPTILNTGQHIITNYGVPFSLGYIRGQVEDMSENKVDVNLFHATAHKLIQMEKHILPKTTFDSHFRFALQEMAVDAIQKLVTSNKFETLCQAGRQGIVLESNGKLRLCELLKNDFGNVRDFNYNIPKMLDNEKTKSITDEVWNSKCRCTWECFSKVSIAFDKKKWPRLFFTAMKKAIK